MVSFGCFVLRLMCICVWSWHGATSPYQSVMADVGSGEGGEQAAVRRGQQILVWLVSKSSRETEGSASICTPGFLSVTI